MEVPETLWPTEVWTSGEIEVRRMWVLSPGRDLKCAESRCTESRCFPGDSTRAVGL